MVHKLFFFCCDDWKWNLWDAVMVLTALADMVISYVFSSGGLDLYFMRALRILKVLKTLRILRILRFSRELRLIIDGLMACVTSMYWSFVMLLFTLCMASVFFVQRLSLFLADHETLSATDAEAVEQLKIEFGSVQTGMLSLLKAATGGEDWGLYLERLFVTGPVDGYAFIFFILFFTLAIMNIVTSIFLDKVMNVAAHDADELIRDGKENDLLVANEVMKRFARMDPGTGLVTREAFAEHMHRDSALKARLNVWGIVIGDPGLFFDMVTETAENDQNGVRVETLAHACIGLRGAATAVDLSILGYHIWKMHTWQQRFERYCIEQFMVLGSDAKSRVQAAPSSEPVEASDEPFHSVLRDILSMQGGNNHHLIIVRHDEPPALGCQGKNARAC
eukprot:CAMPEP_0179017916 /NCGR_PEP_ID=MMETSP0796-20121207/4085_1 /TAXON_ID=73915 /ORGANISM="Pyrodinium bahamense, Strain pbaha01" /LENGTH=391 /DNA_ID=CAMNT_0020713659 /DNA_START=171 /DNA_END=1347 /DNA_ORIENTATION=-